MEEDLVGRTLGRYRIVSKIAQGGMATVYLAWHSGLGHHVALKVLLPVFAQDEEFVRRFKREAWAVAKLRHPNIVRIYDAGESEGYHYIAMEYIEGGSLKDLLDRQGGRPLDLATALQIVRQIASALDYAHSRGIIHRDIKPSNILLTKEGKAVLTDLGIAKAVAGTRLTKTLVTMGTPEYMSPEQGKGEEVDRRTDVYSLGVVIYEMLTGRAPFKADTPWAVIHQHVYETPPPLRSLNPRLPEGVARVVERALAKRPQERYASAGELARALEAASEGAPTVARMPVRSIALRAILRRFLAIPALAIKALVVLICLAVLAILMHVIVQPSLPPPTPTSAAFTSTPVPLTPTSAPAMQMATTPVPPSPTPRLPTATPQPSRPTPKPPTPTRTPTPTSTPIGRAPTPTSTPRPTWTPTMRLYPAPVLIGHEFGPSVSHIILKWTWDGKLAPNEYFDVRVWKEGEPHKGIAWEKNTEHHIDLASWPPGKYYWGIAVIRGKNGRWEKDLSPESEAQAFYWRGAPSPMPPSPTPTKVPPTPTPVRPTPTLPPYPSPTPTPPPYPPPTPTPPPYPPPTPTPPPYSLNAT